MSDLPYGVEAVKRDSEPPSRLKMAVFLDVAPCSMAVIDRRFRGADCLHHRGPMIQAVEKSKALMVELVNNTETSVNFYQTTRRHILEISLLLTRRRETLKPYTAFSLVSSFTWDFSLVVIQPKRDGLHIMLGLRVLGTALLRRQYSAFDSPCKQGITSLYIFTLLLFGAK
jgi:hypothetical protein